MTRALLFPAILLASFVGAVEVCAADGADRVLARAARDTERAERFVRYADKYAKRSAVKELRQLDAAQRSLRAARKRLRAATPQTADGFDAVAQADARVTALLVSTLNRETARYLARTNYRHARTANAEALRHAPDDADAKRLQEALAGAEKSDSLDPDSLESRRRRTERINRLRPGTVTPAPAGRADPRNARAGG